jgi:hypothetical protein
MLKIALYKLIARITGNISSTFNQKVNKLSDDKMIKIVDVIDNEKGRFIKFYFSNEYLLEHKEVLRAIYTTLFNNEKFLKFGFNKVIFPVAIS